eukprot:Seg154.14 transcript_id=Seg154.14/GoldUCD/mRNA.D3Y31 product="hypothetical protein" protein_id=Seg154.14/GoldUCD/D3Y31
MGLKFVSILFLLVAAIYAAPAVEEEDDKMMDPAEIDEESLDALIEDENEDDEDEDNLEEEAKDAAKKTCPAVLKGKGFHQLIGYGRYCVCKAPQVSKKGDQTEISEDDVAEHVEGLAEDPRLKKKLSKAAKKKLFNNMVKSSFRRADQCCYCTFNKRIVRLMAFLNKAKIMARKAKLMFYFQFKKMVYAAVGKRRAAAYFRALRRG